MQWLLWAKYDLWSQRCFWHGNCEALLRFQLESPIPWSGGFFFEAVAAGFPTTQSDYAANSKVSHFKRLCNIGKALDRVSFEEDREGHQNLLTLRWWSWCVRCVIIFRWCLPTYGCSVIQFAFEQNNQVVERSSHLAGYQFHPIPINSNPSNL